MIVTINTDASYSFEHKKAAFAFWITSNLGRIQYSGVIQREVDSSVQAELMAIINAVHTLAKMRYDNVTSIIINSDSLHSLEALHDFYSKTKRKKTSKLKDLVEHFFTCLNNSSLKGVKLSFRHVKAHSDTDSKRTWVNEWCDLEAKRWLRIEIKKLKNKK